MPKSTLRLLVLAALLTGCSSSSSSHTGAPTADASVSDAGSGPDSTGGNDGGGPSDARPTDDVPPVDAAGVLSTRPDEVHVPASYVAGTPTPVLFMFHGYGASGDVEEAYADLTAASDAHGFIYVYGNGTVEQPPDGAVTGNRFWNATNACCDLYEAGVNDVQYFDAMLADVESKYTIDPKRVFVFGHSNGGFMAHRLACDRASRVAAILSLEGATWLDQTNCHPSETVSVAEIHGDADTTIYFDGGSTAEGVYPGADTTVGDWATKNGCTGTLADTGQSIALVNGNTTTVSAFSGCPSGVDVQLWLVHGGTHIPALNTPGWTDVAWSWFSSHAKP